MATTEPSKTSRRKRRWGEGPTDNGGGNDVNNNNGESLSKRKSRFSSSPPSSSANGGGGGGGVAPVAATTAASIAPPPPAGAPADPKARAAALQASIQARLAALKARTGGGGASAATSVAKTTLATAPPPPPPSSSMTATANINKATLKRPLNTNNDATKSTNKRAKVFELDMTTTAPARLLEKQQREEQLRAEAKPKEKINPYLAHTVVDTTTSHATTTAVATSKKTLLDNDNETTTTTNNKNGEVLLDNRLAGTHKQRPKSRPINFVTPGTYIALGEKKREQAARAAESGYVSGRKVGNVVKSVGMGGAVTSIDGEGGGGGGYYGAGEAGKVVEERLPARIDAPELELDHFATANKKKILTSLSDVDVEKNDVAIAAAVAAATSSMPYAMEWWDAELLPSKLRKELASEEGKAIASRAKKGLSKKNKGAASAAAAAGSSAGDSISDQYKKDREHHQQLIEKCYQHASISHSKTRTLLQHPVPILTPAQKAALEAAKNKPSTLHLTKAERKRHRKLRRAERLREQQDLQAAGLVPPPEPRLTLSNYMKVLGDQAILDPSKMEATVVEQIQSRKLKHEQMNAERKLTKEQKAAKHARKLAEDTTQSVKVALFYVKDMSHPYHRAKVDLNAQQNGITGGVLECDESVSGVNLVVAEGGEKAIKRYTRLMTVRMRWKGEDFYEEEDDEESEEELMVGEDEEENNNGEDVGEDGNNETKKKKEKRKKFNPNNECELIWTGMAVKRAFNSFMFQMAENSTVARKILEAKGVAHYWDLAVGHVERKEGVVGGGPDDGDYGALRFRLGDGGDGASNDMME